MISVSRGHFQIDEFMSVAKNSLIWKSLPIRHPEKGGTFILAPRLTTACGKSCLINACSIQSKSVPVFPLSSLLIQPVDTLNCICNNICMFVIRYSVSVEHDLMQIKVFLRRRILDSIDQQLSHVPTEITRNRKLLYGLVPPFDADPPVWELRVGEYRVFYDVDETNKIVYVRAVRHKPPHKTTEEIL